MMQRSVITAVGPLPEMPAASLVFPPVRNPTDVMKSSFSTKARCRLLHDDQYFFRRRADFWSATRSRQPGFRPVIRSNHRRVDVCKPIELRRAEKPYVDPSALKPIAEYLSGVDTTFCVGRLG